MNTRLFLINAFLIFSHCVFSQKTDKTPEKPKLVIGIVVDQMRYDYLYRYWDKYGNGGFKRLMADGFNCENTHYNYVPTSTGPGHASVYTGTTPAIHGIAGNDWFVRETGKNMYVTDDPSVTSVGVESVEGKMSPKNLLATTVADELKLFNNMKSKVIGISLKDRGSILPAGHTANAAYWYDGKSGNWITSTFYMQDLPPWVKSFNDKKIPDQYLKAPWNTLLPIEQYTESLPDDQQYKQAFSGEKDNRFPHNLPVLKEKSGLDLLRSTPFGNTFTLDFALQTIESESMGKGNFTDFLAVSFSSPDYIGHRFGVHSIEVEDTYLRLDKEIERLLNYVDKNFGKNNVLIFLTADHAAAYTPKYLKTIKVPTGHFNEKIVTDTLERYLNGVYGQGDYILAFKNAQIYLNQKLIFEKEIKGIEDKCITFLSKLEGISRVVDAGKLVFVSGDSPWIQRIQNGIYPKRSGDLVIVFEPAWFESQYASQGGTTHGSGYNYDTHVPLLWYGWNVKKGSSSHRWDITDIAPTLSGLLNISAPNGSIGQNYEDWIKREKQ